MEDMAAERSQNWEEEEEVEEEEEEEEEAEEGDSRERERERRGLLRVSFFLFDEPLHFPLY